MRLYPPIWTLIRVAAKPDVIDGKEIRVGDRMALFAYIMHHSAKYWNDPEEFVPDRFSATRRRSAPIHLAPDSAAASAPASAAP